MAMGSTTVEASAPPAAASGPWYSKLWTQVLIAMALGVLLGALSPRYGAAMQPLGDAFIKAIRMLIAPIIFCTVVNGIAHMADMARVGRVALKALVYFEVMTTAALIIGLVAVNLLKPGVGMNVDLATCSIPTSSKRRRWVSSRSPWGYCRIVLSAPSRKETFSRFYFYPSYAGSRLFVLATPLSR
jgi:aerobic C4-dicarboxylate transport protein